MSSGFRNTCQRPPPLRVTATTSGTCLRQMGTYHCILCKPKRIGGCKPEHQQDAPVQVVHNPQDPSSSGSSLPAQMNTGGGEWARCYPGLRFDSAANGGNFGKANNAAESRPIGK